MGTADTLPFAAGSFDVVIAGFFYYLLDPADLFVVAAAIDRVLADEGWVGGWMGGRRHADWVVGVVSPAAVSM